MPDDPIIATTRGDLGDIYADSAKKEFYCFVECPPHGRLRLGICSGAFDTDADSFNDADGTLLLSQRDKFVDSKASETVAMLVQLNPQWHLLWPKIYDALLQVRSDFGCTADITKQNSSFVLTPPDADEENWGCELELVPWDGYYVVEFTSAGEVIDAVAMF